MNSPEKRSGGEVFDEEKSFLQVPIPECLNSLSYEIKSKNISALFNPRMDSFEVISLILYCPINMKFI